MSNKKHFVFSTATTSIAFVEYGEAKPNRFPEVKRRVTILGGANLPKKTLFTPRGVATAVSDDELAFLSQDRKFSKFVKDGYMTVARDKSDLETAVRDMTPKDRCAPLTAADCVKPVKVTPMEAAAA